jgi:hypothetical protein
MAGRCHPLKANYLISLNSDIGAWCGAWYGRADAVDALGHQINIM